MPAKIITFLNQKGGVGKSSCVFHISGALCKMGARVLVVDLDPQSSLTQGFLGPDAARMLDPMETVFSIFAAGAPADLAIRPSGIPGIDLLPGSRFAAEFNVPTPHAAPIGHQFAIRNAFGAVADRYDFILQDAPPNLYLSSWAALVASQYIVVPLAPENFAAQGLIDVQESIGLVQSGANPGLELLGFLVGMRVARKKVHDFFEEQLRLHYGPLVFESVIPHSTDFLEALMFGKPVGFHKPKGAGAKAASAVASEMVARIAGASNQVAEAA